jgi:hypothetical protein
MLHRNGSSSIVACVFVVAGMFLLSSCLAVDVCCVSTIPSFRRLVTVWTEGNHKITSGYPFVGPRFKQGLPECEAGGSANLSTATLDSTAFMKSQSVFEPRARNDEKPPSSCINGTGEFFFLWKRGRDVKLAAHLQCRG